MRTLMCAFAALLAISLQTGAEKIVPIIENGAAAPIFMLPSTDGKRVGLRDYCGVLREQWKQGKEKQIVILSFCASYCVPCRREIPQLEAYAKTAPKDVKVIFISVDSLGEQAVLPFLKEMNITQTMLMDRYGQVMKKYGVKKLPSLFIVDKDGNMQFQGLNGFPEELDLAMAITKKVDEIRQKVAAAPADTPAAVKVVPRDTKIRAVNLFFSGKSTDDILKETGLSAPEFEQVKQEALAVLQEHLN